MLFLYEVILSKSLVYIRKNTERVAESTMDTTLCAVLSSPIQKLRWDLGSLQVKSLATQVGRIDFRAAAPKYMSSVYIGLSVILEHRKQRVGIHRAKWLARISE